MNSLINTTGATPNQILYGLFTRDALSTLNRQYKHIAREDQRELFRLEAADAIDFANARAKLRYNKSHKKLEFNIGDRAYLRLHRGYTLPNMSNKKLSNQRVGPFEVTQRVGKLAYRLKLPPIMKIHPVVLVAQLVPAEGPDPYERPRPSHPGPVKMEGNSPTKASNGTCAGSNANKVYEVERVVSKRRQRYRRSEPRTEYQVKWVGWGSEWNQWISEEDCAGAPELIREYELSQRAV